MSKPETATNATVMITFKHTGQFAFAALCFVPPVLIALGVIPEDSGSGNVRSWALEGLVSIWWGRLLLAVAWFGLGWACYRAVYKRQSAA